MFRQVIASGRLRGSSRVDGNFWKRRGGTRDFDLFNESADASYAQYGRANYELPMQGTNHAAQRGLALIDADAKR
jgi:hypothetical protein